MKLTNHTIYSTRDLKKIMTRIALDELNPDKAKRVHFKIVYSKRTNHSGCAYVGGIHGTLRLPKPPLPLDKFKFAMVVAHEMAHLRGLHHGAAMQCVRYSWTATANGNDYRSFYAWVSEYSVAVKEPVLERPKAKNEVLAGRVIHAQKMLTKNEAKASEFGTSRVSWLAAILLILQGVSPDNKEVMPYIMAWVKKSPYDVNHPTEVLRHILIEAINRGKTTIASKSTISDGIKRTPANIMRIILEGFVWHTPPSIVFPFCCRLAINS